MIKRDVLDANGNKIGEVEFPNGTPEAEIAIKLAMFSTTPPPEAIPDVTPRQIRQAIILSGMPLSNIDAAIDSLPEPFRSLAHAEWEYSISFQRHRPLVAQVGAALGKNSEDLDALWKFAATL